MTGATHPAKIVTLKLSDSPGFSTTLITAGHPFNFVQGFAAVVERHVLLGFAFQDAKHPSAGRLAIRAQQRMACGFLDRGYDLPAS